MQKARLGALSGNQCCVANKEQTNKGSQDVHRQGRKCLCNHTSSYGIILFVVHHTIVLLTRTSFGQCMLLSGTHMASHSPRAFHFTSHSTLLLPSKRLPMMVSTSKSFGKSQVHTQDESINHHHQSIFQHHVSYHMVQWASNAVCDTCHTPHHNHIHLFLTTNTASVVMVCAWT